MDFTIKNKLFGIGGFAAVAMVGLIGFSLVTNSAVRKADEENDVRQDQIATINQMRLDTTGILLGAMDSIVDKDSGEVDAGLKEEVTESANAVREALPKLLAMADTAEEKELAQSANDGLLVLMSAVEQDLFTAIETGVDDSEYAKFDDAIDGTGAEVDEILFKYFESVTEEAAESSEALEAQIIQAGRLLMISGGIVLAMLGAALWSVIRSITVPMAEMVSAMRLLADKDYSVEVPAIGKKDEIGDMAGAVQIFKENGQRVERLEEEQKEAAIEAEKEKTRMMNELADNFDASVGSIVNGVSSASEEMQTASSAMAATAEESTAQAGNVASASEQSSQNIKTVAAATEELKSSISEIARQVDHSAEIAKSAAADAGSTQGTIQNMSQEVDVIGDVVSLITDIASQTNLLALNATIEAARAGDAGKGFAVVASEVKTLADQTAKATEQISGQISSIQAVTSEAVTAIDGVATTIEKVNEIATSISAAVEEQSAATQEIATNVEQVASGAQEISSNISGVTEAAAETGTAATQMTGTASELASQSETLRKEVNNFLQQVRAS